MTMLTVAGGGEAGGRDISQPMGERTGGKAGGGWSGGTNLLFSSDWTWDTQTG